MTRIIIDASTVYVPTVSRRAVRVKVWGGGGGGAGGNSNDTQCWGGGSGGGGAYVSQVLAFHTGVGVQMAVGAGGTAGGEGSPGGPGGASWVGRLRELFAPGGAGGPTIDPETPAVAAIGGQALAARGRYKASGGAGGLSGDYLQSSEGSGGGGAGSNMGDGGYGVGGSSFVPGAGGLGGVEGGAGGQGGDSPFFTSVADPQPGFVPGGGGGGGGAGLVLHPPTVEDLDLSYLFTGASWPSEWTICSDLTTLATWFAPATPLILVFLLTSGPHVMTSGASHVYLLALSSFGPVDWEAAGGIYSEFALTWITTPPTDLTVTYDGDAAVLIAGSPWVYTGQYYAIDSNGAQSVLANFRFSVSFE